MQFPTGLLFPALLASTSLVSAAPSPAVAVAKTASSVVRELAGTYSLVNTTSTYNGEPIPDVTYGAAPMGLLTYTPTGWMSATNAATEKNLRPEHLTFPYLDGQSDADWALIGKHTLAYAGPFSINTALPFSATSGQLFHGPLTVSNVPSMVGKKHVRNYKVIEAVEDKTEVTYLVIGSERGGGFKGELWWKKVD